MSERKVLTKYYPPDFDPSQITRQKKPRDVQQKLQTVRLMSPFSMRCNRYALCHILSSFYLPLNLLANFRNSCGEYIYKGRKFNARKQTTDERYLSIQIYRFYIRCTRCSAEITFKTDPKHMDYVCESGAKRNFEPWREAKLTEETEEERLDRLAREEEERDVMADLEAKTLDAKTEMAIADSLDDIRLRNARIARNQALVEEEAVATAAALDAKTAQEREDEEAARRAFHNHVGERVTRLVPDEDAPSETSPEIIVPPTTFQRTKKKKKDAPNLLGIKKKKVET
jgi:hypothetical protein